MRPGRIDEPLLLRYLLGELPEEEQVQVEDRAFSDPDFLVALETAEADLIDAWVRRDLPQSQRRAFEARFLNSPQRRRKVEFASDLAKAATQFRAPAPLTVVQPVPARESWLGLL